MNPLQIAFAVVAVGAVIGFWTAYWVAVRRYEAKLDGFRASLDAEIVRKARQQAGDAMQRENGLDR